MLPAEVSSDCDCCLERVELCFERLGMSVGMLRYNISFTNPVEGIRDVIFIHPRGPWFAGSQQLRNVNNFCAATSNIPDVVCCQPDTSLKSG